MSVEIRVNGKTYNLFKQVDLTTSLDNFSGEARLITTEAVNDISIIKPGDLVEIYLDGIQKLTGYAEKVSDSESNASHHISYRARDKVLDIIDSSVPDNAKTLKGITTLKQLCYLVISGLGMDISVIDRVGGSFTDDLKAGDIGQGAGDFLQEYARKVQSFLNTDGKGNVLIRRPEGQLQTMLLQLKDGLNNNILDSNIDIDVSKRFYKYVVRSNSNLSAKKKTDNLSNVGVAFDNDIRKTRVFEKVAESPMTAEECKNAAAEEANIRRIRSFNYRCKVVGYSANGELWEDGKFVTVKDDKKGMDGVFVIKDCAYSYSNAGEFTIMNLTLSDAYTAEAELSPVAQRTSKNATTYTVKSGDTLSGVAATNNVTLVDLLAVNPQIENPDLIQEGQVVNIPVTGGN
jgi:prophage tail gpP-like protein